MKRFWVLVLCLMLSLGLGACGGNSDVDDTASDDEVATPPQPSQDDPGAPADRVEETTGGNDGVDQLPEELTYTVHLRLYTEEEGGRHTPIRSNYRPTLKIGDKTVDVITVILPPEIEMLLPGEEADVTLIIPASWYQDYPESERPIYYTVGEKGHLLEDATAVGDVEVIAVA